MCLYAVTLGIFITLTGAKIVMTGPFSDTTVLNSPACNMPDPFGHTSICASNGSIASADICAANCASNKSCTAYTWHQNTSDMTEWASICVFRTDGAWEPLTGASGHFSGQKIDSTPPVWPINDGFDKLPVMWFGANTSGLDSEETLALISRHRVGGYGWQQGTGSLNPDDNLGRGEVHLVAAATHLNDYLQQQGVNSTLVFVYRQIQVALRLFATAQTAADNKDNDDFWLHDPASGRLCLAGQPWGTSDPFWNFSNPRAADYWIDVSVAEVAAESSDGVRAVFFDETDQAYCGYWKSGQGGCAAQSAELQAQLQAANNAMLARQVALLNRAGVFPLLSMDNRMQASGDGLQVSAPCSLPQDATVDAIAAAGGVWARFYENWPGSFWVPDSRDLHAAMISNAILEGARGIPQLIHVPAGNCPDPGHSIPRPGRLGGPLEYYIATFLIIQTEQSVFGASTNWYDNNFCWHSEYDVQYGKPLHDAVRVSPYAWYRNFTACNVFVDTQSGVGQVALL